MTISRTWLCAAYALAGLVALVGTWGNNAAYLGLGFLGANARFWQDTLANPASRSITVDLLWLMWAAVVWMVIEARRLAMRGVCVYVVLGALVAISAAFPAFMIHRERALAARGGRGENGVPDRAAGPAVAGRLSRGDIVGLLVLALVALGYTVRALRG